MLEKIQVLPALAHVNVVHQGKVKTKKPPAMGQVQGKVAVLLHKALTEIE